jgi:hypothetical protein
VKTTTTRTTNKKGIKKIGSFPYNKSVSLPSRICHHAERERVLSLSFTTNNPAVRWNTTKEEKRGTLLLSLSLFANGQ